MTRPDSSLPASTLADELLAIPFASKIEAALIRRAAAALEEKDKALHLAECALEDAIYEEGDPADQIGSAVTAVRAALRAGEAS